MSCLVCRGKTEFRQIFCSEECALRDHAEEHPGDAQNYWGECNLCAAIVEGEIEVGKRTPNGDLIEEEAQNVTQKAV